ncbi:hypothetical protein SAICODRAFT_31299 [Saitoella complicata NRRL Y-17804]|uniref:uncharacterized protein n=1 Tax=Saitoella complicata (strain BCRC 22490 / CBS 7301 / JCM 7358 / NBRC 10748 / NRRL Y-17804) TaxID=698492 RepID=UPI000866EF41|nr:uncharacterized protein SAICODRAFT_31299 [Saitoella complicata NRRL Y-17804]ODQ51333.1 hypothetical protein SAICODRAFT_31299 [Saitoella complicata NRRL Y-17804]
MASISSAASSQMRKMRREEDWAKDGRDAFKGAEKEDERLGRSGSGLGSLSQKDMNEMIRLHTKGSGTVEVLDLTEGEAGEESFA